MLLLVTTATWLLKSCDLARIQDNYLEKLRRFVSDNEAELTKHAELVLAGKIDKREPSVVYAPPATKGINKRVLGVTYDTNRNVYFILTDSFTTFDVGIVYSREGPPFPGYPSEPQIVTNIHLLRRNWYYYKAR